MTKLRVERMEQLCQGRPQLWNDLWRVGRLSVDGTFIELSDEDFEHVNREHQGPVPLGDIIKVLAKPVAAVLGIGNCSGCSERQLSANLFGAEKK